MIVKTFRFAEQVHPITGQVLTEGEYVSLPIRRTWNALDRQNYPQATRQLRADEELLVDVDGYVWKVTHED